LIRPTLSIEPQIQLKAIRKHSVGFFTVKEEDCDRLKSNLAIRLNQNTCRIPRTSSLSLTTIRCSRQLRLLKPLETFSLILLRLRAHPPSTHHPPTFIAYTPSSLVHPLPSTPSTPSSIISFIGLQAESRRRLFIQQSQFGFFLLSTTQECQPQTAFLLWNCSTIIILFLNRCSTSKKHFKVLNSKTFNRRYFVVSISSSSLSSSSSFSSHSSTFAITSGRTILALLLHALHL
jgi:hypothetical protein